jgi:hypothetical protein
MFGAPGMTIGAVVGGITGAIGGGVATYAGMKAISSMSENTYLASAGGPPAPLASYSSETGSTLVVDNAIFTNDNLGERAYESRVYV